MATDGNNRPGRKSNNDMSDGKIVSLGRDVQVKIGQHLRTMYDEVVKQGVPDHLNDLLGKLDQASNKADQAKDKSR
jgi:hypothetical protein